MARGLVSVLAAGLTLTGCAVGRPLGFAGRTDSFCGDALTTISKLAPPATLEDKMRFATDRYTAIERTVSELTDSSLPGGASGQQLRERWLRPARGSLQAGRAVLDQLRTAIQGHDTPAADRAFARSLSIGTDGVDDGLLRQRGLMTCATLFAPG